MLERNCDVVLKAWDGSLAGVVSIFSLLCEFTSISSSFCLLFSSRGYIVASPKHQFDSV